MIAVQPNFWGRITHCGICGRTLTDPDSVQRGIGPICNHKRDLRAPMDEQDEFLSDPPLTEMLICQRRGHRYCTNVQRLVIQHSPSGFAWGYSGSGPSDLALNLAEHALSSLGYTGKRVPCWKGDCFEAAFAMHHDLKAMFVAGMPQDGNAAIPWRAITDYVQLWLCTEGAAP